ncbi:MAG TPA: alpha/beta hydrolase [Allosphingosinicella sp.]|jgi:pimeloyl-ACP methyl ester carboxylesterase
MKNDRDESGIRTQADYKRPSWGQLLAEGPAAARLLGAQLRRARVREDVGRGRPVLVIPAFLANDLVTAQLRRTLKACGFHAWGWSQGPNLGARRGKFERLLRRIDWIAAAYGPVSLVGWSLGGLYARELAKRRPETVRMVATMGTPFSGGLRRNNAWKLYEAINDHDVDHPPIRVDPAEKPPVRTLAFWSPRDGIVAPASSRGQEGERDEAIELTCRHNEFVSDPQALRALVRALAD